MTKQEFVTEFVLRYMTSDSVVREDVRPNINSIITEAKDVWNAIQAREDYDIPRLTSLSKKALARLTSGKYIAQYNDGDWVVFETEPKLHPSEEIWKCGDGQCVRFARELPPLDYTKQCYLISDILGE